MVMYWFLLLSLGIACLEVTVTVNSLSEPAQHLWSARVKDMKSEQ